MDKNRDARRRPRPLASPPCAPSSSPPCARPGAACFIGDSTGEGSAGGDMGIQLLETALETLSTVPHAAKGLSVDCVLLPEPYEAMLPDASVPTWLSLQAAAALAEPRGAGGAGSGRAAAAAAAGGAAAPPARVPSSHGDVSISCTVGRSPGCGASAAAINVRHAHDSSGGMRGSARRTLSASTTWLGGGNGGPPMTSSYASTPTAHTSAPAE
eukprot:200537-Chlamydomonas_euryale.AAC.7